MLTRLAQAADAAAIWRLVSVCPELDSNSSYAYHVLCTHFASTCVVAEEEGRLLGFVTAFQSPADPAVCFLWQAAVDPALRGRGVAAAMHERLLAALPDGVCFLEATVAPDNAASHRTLRALARRLDAALVETPYLAAADFTEAHVPENLVRIGPFPARAR